MNRSDHMNIWPELPLDGWTETYDTLHMWSQVVGKVRLMQAPLVNHWREVPLHVTSRGLTTTPIPHGTKTFETEFDFIEHRLEILTSEGKSIVLPLESRSFAAFYAEVMDRLERLGVPVRIRPEPVEVEEAIPFDEDKTHATCEAAADLGRWDRGSLERMPSDRECLARRVFSLGDDDGYGPDLCASMREPPRSATRRSPAPSWPRCRSSRP